MVHFDFSDGNYNIDYTTGAINVFDFDNCRTCWYLFDIANLWSHGLGWVAWNTDTNARHAYMNHYMNKVLEGYRAECKVEDEELEHLELMVNAVLVENIIDDFEVLKAMERDLSGRFIPVVLKAMENDEPVYKSRNSLVSADGLGSIFKYILQ